MMTDIEVQQIQRQLASRVFLVGGAVRDELLNLTVKDQDWVVVRSSPNELLELGFTQVGQDFPVFLHPVSKEEYGLARQERKTGKGYQGFDFTTDQTVSLEHDLARRDLTINAMAKASNGDIIDPFNGQSDLQHKLLKHVSPAFVEDPLRVLRVARFHATLAQFGFQIAPETKALMSQMVKACELNHLTPERVWLETQKALRSPHPQVYFQSLHEVGALASLFPEIAVLDGVPQHPQYHPEIDTFVHIMYSLEAARRLTSDVDILFAVLTHDLGKGVTPKAQWPSHKQHEANGVPLVIALCDRLKVSKQCKNLALKVCRYHLEFHRCFEHKPSTTYTLLKNLNAFQQSSRLDDWIIACVADRQGRGATRQDWAQQLQEPIPNITFFKDAFNAANQVTIKDIAPHIQTAKDGQAIAMALDEKRINAIRAVHQAWGSAE